MQAKDGVALDWRQWRRFDAVSAVDVTAPVSRGKNTVAARRVLVIWDGSPIYRRAEVREFVLQSLGSIRMEFLPPDAPDRNPWGEGGWHHLKGVEMANLVCRDVEELHYEFHLAVGRLRRKRYLAKSFFAQAGLVL